MVLMMMIVMVELGKSRMSGRTGTMHRSSRGRRTEKISPHLEGLRDDCISQLARHGYNGTVAWCIDCVYDYRRCGDPTGTSFQYEEVTIDHHDGSKQKCILDRASIGGQYVRCRRPYQKPTATEVVLGLAGFVYIMRRLKAVQTPGLRW